MAAIISDEQARQLHELYQAGASLMELSLDHHYSEKTISQSFKRLGLPLRGKGGVPGKPKRQVIDGNGGQSGTVGPTARIVRASVARRFR